MHGPNKVVPLDRVAIFSRHTGDVWPKDTRLLALSSPIIHSCGVSNALNSQRWYLTVHISRQPCADNSSLFVLQASKKKKKKKRPRGAQPRFPTTRLSRRLV
jgi:hypothetical protein